MWHIEYLTVDGKRVFVLVGAVTLVEAVMLTRKSDPHFDRLVDTAREMGTVWFLRQEVVGIGGKR